MERKIKIGDSEYTIKYINRISGNHKKNKTFGNFNYNKKLIKVTESCGEEEDTLFHELTHAILHELHDRNPKLERRLRQLYKDEEIVGDLSQILKGMFNLKV